LGKFGQIWANLGKSGQIWVNLGKFGQSWENWLGKFGQIGISSVRKKFKK
jgi:hypothetical protein